MFSFEKCVLGTPAVLESVLGKSSTIPGCLSESNVTRAVSIHNFKSKRTFYTFTCYKVKNKRLNAGKPHNVEQNNLATLLPDLLYKFTYQTSLIPLILLFS